MNRRRVCLKSRLRSPRGKADSKREDDSLKQSDQSSACHATELPSESSVLSPSRQCPESMHDHVQVVFDRDPPLQAGQR